MRAGSDTMTSQPGSCLLSPYTHKTLHSDITAMLSNTVLVTFISSSAPYLEEWSMLLKHVQALIVYSLYQFNCNSQNYSYNYWITLL